MLARPLFLRSTLLALSVAATLLPASAMGQDPAVMARLVQFGGMNERDAAALLGKLEAALRQNAEQGGERFDSVRTAVLRALAGPRAQVARTRPAYDQQLQAVLSRMKQGPFDERMLEALLRPGPNAAVMCAYQYGLTMPECDALLAASARQPAAVPYAPPDDGKLLEEELRRARVRRRTARRIAEAMAAVMLGVPRSLTRDEKGRTLVALMEACPGGLASREAQIRAWHVGPTPGLVRCIVQTLARREGAAAEQRLREWFGLRPRAARALLRWAGTGTDAGAAAPVATPAPAVSGAPAASAQVAATPAAVATPSAPIATPAPGAPSATAPPRAQAPSATPLARQASSSSASAPPPRPRRGAAPDPRLAEQWRVHARQLYGQGRFLEAVQAYRNAVRAHGGNGRLWAGLGASLLHAGDPRGAVEAYRKAVELVPGHMPYRVSLARALVMAGKRAEAVRTLREVLVYDPQNRGAVQGLLALGEEPKPLEPELPETPSRDQVIMVMRPLKAAIADCSPDFHGTVAFEVEVKGESGEVTRVRAQGELHGTPEGECMEAVIRSATFPRFKKRKFSVVYPYQL